MGYPEIENKLKNAFKERIESEAQVVFILTRIRKYLESQKLKREFSILNFFCNWALHTEINKTKPIYDFLKSENDNTDDLINIFSKEFENFLIVTQLIEGNLSSNSNLKLFSSILLDIYSSTPLIIDEAKKISVEIIKDKSDNTYSLCYNKI